MPIWRNRPSMPKVRASSGTIGTMCLPMFLSLSSAVRMRTKAMVVEISRSPVPSSIDSKASSGGTASWRRVRRARAADSRRAPRAARADSASPRCPRAACGTAGSSMSSSGTGMLKRSRNSRSASSSSFFCWCATIWPSAALAEAEAFDGLGEDHGRLPLVAAWPPRRPHTPCAASWPPRFRRQISSSDMLATISLSSGYLPKKCSRV